MTLNEYLAMGMLAALGAFLFSGLPVALVLVAVGGVFGVVGFFVDAVRPGDFGNVALRIFGTLTDTNNLSYAAVPPLILMGALLHHSGVARQTLSAIRSFSRRMRGSLAVAVLLVGVVLAPTTGVVAAAVGAIAIIAFDPLLAEGLPPAFASGLVAAAGTLGVVVPPSILLFLLSDVVGAKLAYVFSAVLVPMALLVALYCAYAVLASPRGRRVERDGSHGAPARMPAQAWAGLAEMAFLVAIVLGSIMSGLATPSESAAIGAAGAALFTLGRGAQARNVFAGAFVQTVRVTAMIFFIFIGASVFSLVFQLLGGLDAVDAIVEGFALPAVGKLVLILAVVFVLGFFLDWVEIVLIFLPIFAPILRGLSLSAHVGVPGLVSTWLIVLFAFNLQTSFMTPPFGFALFLLKGAAPRGVAMRDIYRGIVPFVLIQLALVAAVIAFPGLATWLPGALFRGDFAR